MECTHPERPWSDLPQELLSAIANFLIPNPNPNPNPLDILTFRSVCNSWRSSCPPLYRPDILSPLLPLGTGRPLPPAYNRLCSSHSSIGSVLSVTVIYSLRPPIESSLMPNNVLLFVDEFDSGKLKIRQPFSRGSYSVPIFFPVYLNLFDFHAREISRFYNLSYCYYYDDKRDVKLTKPQRRSEDVLKVVLFPDGSAAVALFDGGKLGLIKLDVGIYQVGLCRNSCSRWDVIHGGKGFRFDDIIDYKGRVLGVDRGGRVYEIGHSSSEINPVVRSTAFAFRGGRRKRLVESLGWLYLVVRYNVRGETDATTTFQVYELNAKRRKWVEINSIGDRVFLFGIEFSFSASAQEVSCGKNCILFKHQSFKSYRGDQIDDNEVFCQSSNGLDIGICHLDDAAHVGVIASYSGYSNTFWPPPAWIWPINRLERLGKVGAAFDEIFMKMFEKFKTKFSELTLEGGGSLSCDDFPLFDGPWADIINRDDGVQIWSILLHLKKLINTIKVTELIWEKTVQDASSINMLNQAQIASLGTMSVEENAEMFQIEEWASDLVCQFYLCHCLAEES